MRLWAGRLSGELDERVNDLNSSIKFDSRLFREDIQGSMAHAAMLGKAGIVSEADAAAIVAGLAGILSDIEGGRLAIDMAAEDIHTFVEAELTARIGEPGKKLHTARSRNDQVILDMRMHLAGAIDGLIDKAKAVVAALCDIADEHLTTVMPGYTHMQRAQPVTLAHHLMAYAQMLLRDIDRLKDCKRRTEVMPLGSGALAATTYPIDREAVSDTLGFGAISANSMDAVADRDFVLELAGCLSILMMHLSRLGEEIVLWCSWEFGFMVLADEFSTGSSIMPQKKNPDIAELIRGKTARVYGHNVALLTMMKALPLAYNKDMQEDKEAIFDAIDTASLCLELVAPMLRTAVFRRDRMARAAAEGFINATDCADYLVSKGVPFRDAYRIVGGLVDYCIKVGTTLEELPIEVFQQHSAAFDEGVYDAIDLVRCVTARAVPGGPAPEAVKAQIQAAKAQISAHA
jgi:argininosuccinate lyase